MVRRKNNKLCFMEEIVYPKRFWMQLAVCSALFLLIAALKSVQAQPVQAVLSAVRSVATTEMEWDESIGKLEFVGNFVPESVMVFWNSSDRTLIAPLADGVLLDVQGDKAVFEGKGSVLCGGEGRVESVKAAQDGYCVTIAHDNGLTTQISGMQSVYVQVNDRVHEGQSIGSAQNYGQAGRIAVHVMEGRHNVEAAQWLR